MIELVADAMVTGFEEDGDKVGVATADGRTFSGVHAGAALAQGPGRSSGRRPARAVAIAGAGRLHGHRGRILPCRNDRRRW